jgi:hypothetical protein
MSVSPEKPFARAYFCRDCGSEVGFRSRRRSLTERYILPFLLLKPVRCGECFRRDYRLLFTDVRDRIPGLPRVVTLKNSTSPKRNVA